MECNDMVDKIIHALDKQYDYEMYSLPDGTFTIETLSGQIFKITVERVD